MDKNTTKQIAVDCVMPFMWSAFIFTTLSTLIAYLFNINTTMISVLTIILVCTLYAVADTYYKMDYTKKTTTQHTE